jgi:hypothetical protein
LIRLLKNSHLATAAMDSMEGFENRLAYSLGIAPQQCFTLSNWQPTIKRTFRNVYSPFHRMLLSVGPQSTRWASSGGGIALLGGVAATAATFMQLKEHAKFQHLSSWDRDSDKTRHAHSGSTASMDASDLDASSNDALSLRSQAFQHKHLLQQRPNTRNASRGVNLFGLPAPSGHTPASAGEPTT